VAAGAVVDDEGFVWSPTVDGSRPRTPDSLTRAFAPLCNSLESEAIAAGHNERYQFRFHDLRHFSATELIGAGVDIRTVAGRLGHSDPAITLRVFAHALEECDRAAAQPASRKAAQLAHGPEGRSEFGSIAGSGARGSIDEDSRFAVRHRTGPQRPERCLENHVDDLHCG
jgi:Phage integrase family